MKSENGSKEKMRSRLCWGNHHHSPWSWDVNCREGNDHKNFEAFWWCNSAGLKNAKRQWHRQTPRFLTELDKTDNSSKNAQKQVQDNNQWKQFFKKLTKNSDDRCDYQINREGNSQNQSINYSQGNSNFNQQRGNFAQKPCYLPKNNNNGGNQN